MISRVDYWLDRLSDEIDDRLEASGVLLANGIKDSIRAQNLIDTGQMINDVRYARSRRRVRAGNTLKRAKFPNNGFRHHRSGEIVGPYRFIEKGAAASEGPLRLLWKQRMRV